MHATRHAYASAIYHASACHHYKGNTYKESDQQRGKHLIVGEAARTIIYVTLKGPEQACAVKLLLDTRLEVFGIDVVKRQHNAHNEPRI